MKRFFSSIPDRSFSSTPRLDPSDRPFSNQPMASTARASKMSLKRSVDQCEDSVEDVEVGKKGKSVRHLWSDNQISIVIQLLKEHDDPQWRVHTGWSKEAWTKITSELNARFGTQGVKLTRDQVKEKEHGLKRKFKLFKELVEESGFGWDNEMQCVVTPPDVWEDLKEVIILDIVSSYNYYPYQSLMVTFFVCKLKEKEKSTYLFI